MYKVLEQTHTEAHFEKLLRRRKDLSNVTNQTYPNLH